MICIYFVVLLTFINELYIIEILSSRKMSNLWACLTGGISMNDYRNIKGIAIYLLLSVPLLILSFSLTKHPLLIISIYCLITLVFFVSFFHVYIFKMRKYHKNEQKLFYQALMMQNQSQSSGQATLKPSGQMIAFLTKQVIAKKQRQ